MTQVGAIEVRELTGPLRPVACFERLRQDDHAWWLDSGAAQGARTEPFGRYSFMGSDPYLVLRAHGSRCEVECRRRVSRSMQVGSSRIEGDPLQIARSLLAISNVDLGTAGDVAPFLGGAVGYFGYELGEVCEPVKFEARDDFGLPDMVLLYNDRVLVFDHVDNRVFAVGLGLDDVADTAAARSRAIDAADALASRVMACVHDTGSDEVDPGTDWLRQRRLLGSSLPDGAVAGFSSHEYALAVEAIREEIALGNVYQANLTQRIDLPAPREESGSDAELGWRLYRALRRLNPAPFASFLQLPEVTIASSSPERFLKLDRERRVESRPIKGTRRRGGSEEEDALLAKELESSAKDRAENLMIVDLVRNDLGRVCETGSVDVPELMAIESYATVFQMVSTVRGTLRGDCGVDDLLRATFPPGSMTGAPKIAAMKLIDRIEPVRRGIYSGAIGYLDIAGGLDLSVVIRTLLVRDGVVSVHSGGAVVTDSVPDDEYRESLDKIRALLSAIDWRA